MEQYNGFVSPEMVQPAERYVKAFAQVEAQLNQFGKITLQEMEAVEFQNRMDTKLIFHLDRLPMILAGMKENYQVFEINKYRLNPYQTLYFDTEDLALYLLHHNGKTNRYKIRYRSYLSSDISFFEIKYKNNKGRTIKERIKVPEIATCIDGKASVLLEEITSAKPDQFRPELWVNYSRITFVNINKSERVTVDLALSFKNGTRETGLHDLVIAEVKQMRASAGSPFLKMMKEQGIRSGSISKYCLGTALLCDVKKNNFKKNLMAVNKIINQVKD